MKKQDTKVLLSVNTWNYQETLSFNDQIWDTVFEYSFGCAVRIVSLELLKWESCCQDQLWHACLENNLVFHWYLSLNWIQASGFDHLELLR